MLRRWHGVVIPYNSNLRRLEYLGYTWQPTTASLSRFRVLFAVVGWVLVARRGMDQKRLWISFVLALTVYLLPQSSAQCSLDLGVPFVNIGGVPFQGLFPEYTPSSFIQNGLTYLCYTRSETNSETFSEIRVSVLYQYQGTDGALQLTLSCIGSRWLYDSTQSSLVQLPAADHVTENMTREGCVNCRDSSTTSFGDPTYCSREWLACANIAIVLTSDSYTSHGCIIVTTLQFLIRALSPPQYVRMVGPVPALGWLKWPASVPVAGMEWDVLVS